MGLGLLKKLRSAGKTAIGSGTDGLLYLGIWTAGGAIAGVGVIALYEAFVNGRYDGNLVEQFVGGVKETIPFVANAPAMKVITRDLSAGIIGGVIGAGTYVFNLARKNVSETHRANKAYETRREEITDNADLEIHNISEQERVEVYRAARSPAHAG